MNPRQCTPDNPLDCVSTTCNSAGTGKYSSTVCPSKRRSRPGPAFWARVALDPSQGMIERLVRKSLPEVTPVEGILSPELIARNPAFENRFDLITASSVCAFVPDYGATLALLRALLVPDGHYVQWDWLSPSDDPGFGFTESQIHHALGNAGFADITSSQPFAILRDEHTMPVLMVIATNP